jgi:peptide/nickel transport system permease protein
MPTSLPISKRIAPRHVVSRVFGHRAVRVVTRRILFAVPLLFFVSVLTFVLASLAPGDPAREILGLNASPEAYARLRESLGLDLPLYEQYWRWLTRALHGDLGVSIVSGEPVTHAITSRLPVTLSLLVGALIVSVLVGVGLGLFSAVRGGTMGRMVDAFSLLGLALPSFWLAAVLISVFAVKLGWFPAVGYVPIGESPSRWLQSLVLPVLALAVGAIADYAKRTRQALAEELRSEHIRMAWANGISPASIYFRHALKSASILVVTLVGLQVVALLGGTIFAEYVFALPGLGSLAVDASLRHDLPMIQGIVVLFTLIIVVVNLVVDLAYTWLNPRVHTG